MKRRIHTNMAAAVLGLMSLAACTGKISEQEQMFIDMEDEDGTTQIALVKNGEVLDGLKYDKNSYQLGYNPSTLTYKMIKDDGSYYYLVTCETAPKTGKKVKASIKYTTDKDVVSLSGVKFEVVDINPYTGVIRLWNESTALGVAVVEVK